MKWELEYDEWRNYLGPEANRPPRPGPHPDPKHKWNKKKVKFDFPVDIENYDVETDYNTMHGADSKKTSLVSEIDGSYIFDVDAKK